VTQNYLAYKTLMGISHQLHLVYGYELQPYLVDCNGDRINVNDKELLERIFIEWIGNDLYNMDLPNNCTLSYMSPFFDSYQDVRFFVHVKENPSDFWCNFRSIDANMFEKYKNFARVFEIVDKLEKKEDADGHGLDFDGDVYLRLNVHGRHEEPIFLAVATQS